MTVIHSFVNGMSEKKKQNALVGMFFVSSIIFVVVLSSWTPDLTRLELSHLHKTVIVSRAAAAIRVSIHLSTWVIHSQSHFISLICISHSGRGKTESLSRRQIDVNKITHAFWIECIWTHRYANAFDCTFISDFQMSFQVNFFRFRRTDLVMNLHIGYALLIRPHLFVFLAHSSSETKMHESPPTCAAPFHKSLGS